MHDVRGEQWVVESTAPVGSQAAAVESWSTGDGASIQMIFFGIGRLRVTAISTLVRRARSHVQSRLVAHSSENEICSRALPERPAQKA